MLKRAVSLGTGYVFGDQVDFIGFGAEWGRPADSFGEEASDTNQCTFELYLRWQPLAAVQVVPSIHYVINPALSPSKNDLWFPELRLRVVF